MVKYIDKTVLLKIWPAEIVTVSWILNVIHYDMFHIHLENKGERWETVAHGAAGGSDQIFLKGSLKMYRCWAFT